LIEKQHLAFVVGKLWPRNDIFVYLKNST